MQKISMMLSQLKTNYHTELYIHIADVSIYVEENSKLIRMLVSEGIVIIFMKTSHMLPEYLSTNICSLVPGKKRLALTVKIVLDNQCHKKF